MIRATRHSIAISCACPLAARPPLHFPVNRKSENGGDRCRLLLKAGALRDRRAGPPGSLAICSYSSPTAKGSAHSSWRSYMRKSAIACSPATFAGISRRSASTAIRIARTVWCRRRSRPSVSSEHRSHSVQVSAPPASVVVACSRTLLRSCRKPLVMNGEVRTEHRVEACAFCNSAKRMEADMRDDTVPARFHSDSAGVRSFHHRRVHAAGELLP